MIRTTVVRGERGSVLLSALVLIFVITTLGLALFELGFVESQSSFISQRDARAFEIAQAGVERALERLLRTILNEPEKEASWADGDSTVGAICVSGCVANEFRAATSTYISDTAFDGGSYAISFKLLTVAEASSNPYGQRCIPQSTTSSLCTNLIFVRSTGTMPQLSGYSASRTIQILAQAKPPFTGVTAGDEPGGPMRGNACIAGSINVIGVSGTASLSFGQDACQRNNWAALALDSASLDRLSPLQPVCPPGRTCSCGLPSPDSNCVYSLGATLRVALPTTIPAVVLSSTAYLGQSQANADSETAYHSPSLHGKGPLDAVFVADGCVMPCTGTGTDSFTGVTVTNTVVDGANLTRPYPSNPTPSFPLLTDSVQISGVSYTHYACPHGSDPAVCTPPASNNASRTPSSTNEFFLNHAYHTGCTGLVFPHCLEDDADLRNSLGSASGLEKNTNAFRISITFYNRSGGFRIGEICWRRASAPLYTLEFGIPDCLTPSTPDNPLLVYMNSSFFTIIAASSGARVDYNFRGVAIFLTKGLVKVEETLQSCYTGASSGDCPGPTQRFPEKHMLGVLTTSNMEIGKSTQASRIMGFFYTASSFYSEQATNIVGSMTARRFCFAGGCAFPVITIPQLFEVPYDPRTFPAEMFVGSLTRWAVSSVLGFWLECRPGATPTVPPDVTGSGNVCGYS